jgi:hypothetical protein
VLAVLGTLVEVIAFFGEIVGFVEFAAKIRRWWNDEAEPDPD